MSPCWVRARTATVCSDAPGARSPSSWLRTCPSFEDRSSQAGTPGRTPMVTWPKPLSTWMEPLETSAELDAAVGGLRRDGAERLRDLEVAVGELRVEVAAGLPDQDGAVRRLEDRVAGDLADPDLTVVGRDLDPALGGAHGRVAVRGAQPQVAGGVEIHAAHRALDPGRAEASDGAHAAHRDLGGEPRPGRQLDLHIDRLGGADPADAGPRAGDGEPLAVEVDLGLLRAPAVDRLRGVRRRDGHDRVGAVTGEDLDRADLQVDGEVDGGGGVVGGHAGAFLLGVFVRPRGSAWLVGVGVVRWAG